jgi:hypothetical protein
MSHGILGERLTATRARPSRERARAARARANAAGFFGHRRPDRPARLALPMAQASPGVEIATRTGYPLVAAACGRRRACGGG